MKPLTDEQLTQVLGKRTPATPSPRVTHEEYDPSLDEQVEHYLNPANAPKSFCDEPAWPPNSGAGAWAVRFRYMRLCGGSEQSLAELPLLLSCLRNTRSEAVRHNAVRSIVALVVPPEFRAKISEPVLSECIAAINENSELAFNPHIANGSPDWIGLCSGIHTA